MCCSKGYASAFEIDGDGPTRTISYETFRRVAKTGDQLLYQGKGWTSFLIKAISQSKYSHCGTVIRMKDDSLYVWESTKPNDTFDFLTLTDKDGPRLIDADEQLYEYARKNYAVTYRPLKVYDNKIKENLGTKYAQRDMWKILNAMSKAPYERNLLELANAHKHWSVGGWGRTIGKNTKKSIFCSELNIYTLNQGMGIPLKDPVSGLVFYPEDFAPEDIAWETEGLPFTTPFPLSMSGKEKEEENKIRFPKAALGEIPGVPEGYAVTALLGFPMVVASNGNIDPLMKARSTEFSHTLELYKEAHYGFLSFLTPAQQQQVYGRVLSEEELDAVQRLTQRISDIQTMHASGKMGFSMRSAESVVPDTVTIDFGKNAILTSKE